MPVHLVIFVCVSMWHVCVPLTCMCAFDMYVCRYMCVRFFFKARRKQPTESAKCRSDRYALWTFINKWTQFDVFCKFFCHFLNCNWSGSLEIISGTNFLLLWVFPTLSPCESLICNLLTTLFYFDLSLLFTSFLFTFFVSNK